MIASKYDASRRVRRIIYVGGIYSETDMLQNRAVSPAGNRWQRGFLKGLSVLIPSIVLLAHRQEQIFPLGPAWLSNGGFDWDLEKTRAVNYLNLPFVRATSLRWGYGRALREVLHNQRDTAAIICYNANPWTVEVARRAWAQYHVPTVCIHADYPDMESDWRPLVRHATAFKGNAFCSYGAFMQCPVANKFHLDGGVARDRVRQSKANCDGPITYAGNIAESKGVLKLVECFNTLPGDDLRLHLFGKVDARDGGPAILRVCKSDRRITYAGTVSQEELETALANSAVLINPVDVRMRGNPLNFPSKLHHYLEMGPPIVSAMAEGIAPEYRDLMYCVDQDRNQAAWRRRILDAFEETPEARTIRIGKVEAFLRERLWVRQVGRFVDWIESWRS